MLDSVIGLIERDCARPKLFCAVGQSQNGVGERIIECFSYIKVQDIFGLLVVVWGEMINLLVLFEIAQLLRDACVAQLYHIGELFQVIFAFFLLLDLQRPVEAQPVSSDLCRIMPSQYHKTRKPELTSFFLQFIIHFDKPGLILNLL